MMKSKRRARRGFTLTETLTALAIFSLLTVAVVAGVNAAVKVYREVTAVAEAQSLTSELTQSLSDELRYARNITTTSGGTVTFDSDTFGAGVSVGTSDGQVIVSKTVKNSEGNASTKTYDLLGSKSYTSGLKVDTLEVTYTYDKAKDEGVFAVKITISGGALSTPKETTLSVRALNP